MRYSFTLLLTCLFLSTMSLANGVKHTNIEQLKEFPLAQTVTKILNQRAKTSGHKVELLVAHSHSHSDHIAADKQFTDIAEVIDTNNLTAVTNTFNLNQWPHNTAMFDLGNRKITVLPSPGHQKEAISFYDAKTKWLLTGDTFYPGRLYTRQWQDYPMGSKHHENEASLVLSVNDLKHLNQQLKQLGDKEQRLTLDKFIIYPLD